VSPRCWDERFLVSGGEPSGCGARAILASRRSERSSAPSFRPWRPAHHRYDQRRHHSTTVTVPVTVTIPGSSTATTSTAAAFARAGLRQSSDCENEHEQSETVMSHRLLEMI